MLLLFFALFVLSIFIVFIDDYLYGEQRFCVYFVLCVALILTTGLRPIGFDNDSSVYDEAFHHTDFPSVIFGVEKSYLVLSEITKQIYNNVHVIFMLYALISIPIKFYSICRLTPLSALAFVVYISDFYLLHDCIQIRASVASAFILLSLKPISEGKKIKGALYLLLGTIFHYSTLMTFVILLFNNKTLTRRFRLLLAIIVPISVLMYCVHIDLIQSIPIPYIEDKIDNYVELKDKGIFADFSPLSVNVWARILVYLYVLYFYDTIYEHCKFLPLILKMMAISIISYFSLSGVPVLAERINEMFGVVEIFMFVCVYYTIRPKYAAKLGICLLALLIMLNRLLRLGTFDFNRF